MRARAMQCYMCFDEAMNIMFDEAGENEIPACNKHTKQNRFIRKIRHDDILCYKCDRMAVNETWIDESKDKQLACVEHTQYFIKMIYDENPKATFTNKQLKQLQYLSDHSLFAEPLDNYCFSCEQCKINGDFCLSATDAIKKLREHKGHETWISKVK